MAQATFHFPRGFLWGTATAAHQVEGNTTNNNWSAWEQQPGRILQGHQAGLACDWWNGRWREDFDRARETYQNAHRFSVEWSRIQPAPDRWDESAIDHYIEMLRGMEERGLFPMVTLHHFTDPLWLTEQGGWENPETPAKFDKFVQHVVEALRDYVSYWCTINEPNVYAVSGYSMGTFPPGKKDIGAVLRVYANLIRGHAAAYHTIHSLQPNARVGIAHNYRSMRPHKDWSPLDRSIAGLLDNLYNQAVPRALVDGVMRTPLGNTRIPQAKNTQDFIGINYYTRDYIQFDLRHLNDLASRRYYRPEAELSKTGFIANEPDGMFEALKWANSFNRPIIISENGVEDPDDSLRPTYLIQHLHQAWRAVNFNYPIKGYFHWSLTDNFEWERGWTQRFGLWELDVETQARRKRPSVDLYAEICRENGISAEMVARYAPALFPKMFPG